MNRKRKIPDWMKGGASLHTSDKTAMESDRPMNETDVSDSHPSVSQLEPISPCTAVKHAHDQDSNLDSSDKALKNGNTMPSHHRNSSFDGVMENDTPCSISDLLDVARSQDGGSEKSPIEDGTDERKAGDINATRLDDSDTTTTIRVTPDVRRQSCFYGASCYRKNPQHQKDFAHPGDNDYTDPSTSQSTSDTRDTRPLCQYGAGCYRKNPQHRLDFSHDIPNKAREARPAGKLVESDSDDEDFGRISSDDYNPSGEEDLDDSFVTSDSVGSGESDYEPDTDGEQGVKKKRKKREEKIHKDKKRKK